MGRSIAVTRSRRIGVVALALAAATLIGMPTPAPAHASGVCTENFTTSGSCSFYFRGFPILLSGTATASTGNANVHVWVTFDPAPGVTGPIVGECTHAPTASTARCEGSFGQTGYTLDSTKRLQVITCHVEGQVSGSFSCESGVAI